MFSTNREITFTSLFLIYHYFIQGLILGIFYTTFPLKLKESFNFSEIGMFNTCVYPHFLKILWAPIVDTYYIKSIGLRKTWIISSQIILGILCIILCQYYDYIMNEKKIVLLTGISILINASSATQDIALDALGLALAGKEVNIKIDIAFKPSYYPFTSNFIYMSYYLLTLYNFVRESTCLQVPSRLE